MTPAARTLLVTLALAAAACAARPAAAQLWATPAQRMLFDGRTDDGVRARLAAHGDSAHAKNAADAGESYAWIGVSQLRSGHPDSAASAYARAIAWRRQPEDAYGLAAALLATRRSAAADSAAAAIAALPPDDPESATAETRAWRAWAQARSSGPAAARAELERSRAELLAPATAPDVRERWSRRLGPLLAMAGADAEPLVLPLAIASRGLDAPLAATARAASPGTASAFDHVLAAGIARLDSAESTRMRAAGGRPLAVRVADGPALAAWWFPARAAHAPLLALVTDPWAGADAGPDSLVAQLRRDGVSVALLDPRGSGGSVRAGCALASDWDGREEAMLRTTSADLSALVSAAIATGAVDPKRVAAGAIGPCAMFAAIAAGADRRIAAIVLVDATLAPTDRGPFVAALALAATPAWFQTGPASVEANWIVDRVAGLLPPKQCRVAESGAPGHGLALFRAGPREAQRLSGWLRDAWSSPRATPPAARR